MCTLRIVILVWKPDINLSLSQEHNGLHITGGHNRPSSVYRNTTSAMEDIHLSLNSLAKFVLGGRLALHFLLESQGEVCDFFHLVWYGTLGSMFQTNMAGWSQFTLGVLLTVA